MQVYLLGADLQIHIPYTLEELSWEKRHVSGWVPVEMRRELTGFDLNADPHWVFCATITAMFIGIPAYWEVYKKTKWL